MTYPLFFFLFFFPLLEEEGESNRVCSWTVYWFNYRVYSSPYELCMKALFIYYCTSWWKLKGKVLTNHFLFFQYSSYHLIGVLLCQWRFYGFASEAQMDPTVEVFFPFSYTHVYAHCFTIMLPKIKVCPNIPYAFLC